MPQSKAKPSIASSRSPRKQESAASSDPPEEPLVFPYAAIIPEAPVKPAIPVMLQSLDGQRQFPIYAIPDSGADRSCFPKAWAEPLGIKLAECEKYVVHTGNGKTQHYEWSDRITATIAGRAVKLAACFGNIKVGILGRDDFFQEFFVGFDHRKRITLLKSYA